MTHDDSVSSESLDSHRASSSAILQNANDLICLHFLISPTVYDK